MQGKKRKITSKPGGKTHRQIRKNTSIEVSTQQKAEGGKEERVSGGMVDFVCMVGLIYSEERELKKNPSFKHIS